MSLLLPAHLRVDQVPLSPTQIQVLIEIEPLLKAARLTLACPRCLAEGHSLNAVAQGSNASSDTVWRVNCPCTSRHYQRAPMGQDN